MNQSNIICENKRKIPFLFDIIKEIKYFFLTFLQLYRIRYYTFLYLIGIAIISINTVYVRPEKNKFPANAIQFIYINI